MAPLERSAASGLRHAIGKQQLPFAPLDQPAKLLSDGRAGGLLSTYRAALADRLPLAVSL